MAACIHITRDESILILTLSCTSAANALSLQMLDELNELLDDIEKDASIQIVIVTGEGDRAFCAGADLKERKGMNLDEVRQTVAYIGQTIHRFEQLGKPVIAAINGVAFGGGLELALACDLRIASNKAKLGLTETSLGIIPGAGGTQRLPRLIGIGRAKELIYTAKPITALEAKQYGIVEYVVEENELMNQAKKIANEMVKNAPLALTQAKQAINLGMQTDLTTGLKIENLAYQNLLTSEDRLEGLLAFEEKRLPKYKGK